jgi:hypothetical protein
MATERAEQREGIVRLFVWIVIHLFNDANRHI